MALEICTCQDKILVALAIVHCHSCHGDVIVKETMALL